MAIIVDVFAMNLKNAESIGAERLDLDRYVVFFLTPPKRAQGFTRGFFRFMSDSKSELHRKRFSGIYPSDSVMYSWTVR